MKRYKGIMCLLGILGVVGFGSLDVNCLSVGDISVVDFSGIAGTKVTCEVRANQIYGVERIINCEVLSAPALVVRTVQIPKVEGCRSYNVTFMPYTSVTDRKSRQYAFLNSENCYTETDTGLRKYDDRYCVAVGSGIAQGVGTKLDVHMKNGAVIKCIIGDAKSDRNTNPSHIFHNEDGSVLEMIVDSKQFTGSQDYPIELSGSISYIEVLE